MLILLQQQFSQYILESQCKEQTVTRMLTHAGAIV